MEECQVCMAVLDEQEIICDFCFKEAFDLDLEYDETEGDEDIPTYPDRYKKAKYLQFVADMANHGIPVRHYHGHGRPAAYTNQIITADRIITDTQVPCAIDLIGELTAAVYPR